MNSKFSKCFDDWGNLKDNALNIAYNIGKKEGFRKGKKQGRADAIDEFAKRIEKLNIIENIMLKYNADWYADEDNGIPDCEVLESIWNVIQDNGLDIDIEQDYRKGRADAIDELKSFVHTNVKGNIFVFIEDFNVDKLSFAEQLKENKNECGSK